VIYQANGGEKISSSLRNCRGGVVEVALEKGTVGQQQGSRGVEPKDDNKRLTKSNIIPHIQLQ
jgi:hypothetical protein